ncbi:uncharacterized protein LOC129743105 [Uranotaenia lowii]|uniref:uncharacterized protein LOC129743105 n=1 Tax=Uranotaenia lowii TaxID=190385 RepID=UPI00247893D3|nr:uncharacterized protein LOC129743105 [Uranotaenia lowii]
MLTAMHNQSTRVTLSVSSSSQLLQGVPRGGPSDLRAARLRIQRLLPAVGRKGQCIVPNPSNRTTILARKIIDNGSSESEQPDHGADSQDLSQAFLINVNFFKRKFVGETSGGKICSKSLSGSTVQSILMQIFDIVKPVLAREVLFAEDSGNPVATWGTDNPCFVDLGKFVMLQDSAQKRRVKVEKVTSKLLTTWRHREINIHVHIYSNSVSCKSRWEQVQRQLIKSKNPDRAGAPSNQSLLQLANELREKFGNQFTGHSSSWRLWANFINSCPAHERMGRMNELPPYNTLKFFRSAPISEAVQLHTTRQGLLVAENINEGYSRELELIEQDCEQMIALGNRIKERISALRSRSSINSNLVSAMSEAVRPEENEHSQSIADRVSDMIDSII